MRRRLTLLTLWLAGVLAAAISIPCGLAAALAGRPRALRVAIAHDQALNAALGGSEDETVSSRAGKGAQRGVWHWCVLCRLLNALDSNHCQKSIELDEGAA